MLRFVLGLLVGAVIVGAIVISMNWLSQPEGDVSIPRPTKSHGDLVARTVDFTASPSPSDSDAPTPT